MKLETGYEGLLIAKDCCYEVIKKEYGQEFLNIFKYFKGDLLPLIHSKCRRNMTCGDIDCIQWDYYKKRLRIIESKRTIENNKISQNRLLEFFSQIKIDGYNIEVFKIVGDPPFKNFYIIIVYLYLAKKFQ